MSAKLYVELEPLLEFLEHQYPRHPVLTDYVRRHAVHMPPPDPPDHGRHLDGDRLLEWLKQRIDQYKLERAEHHRHEASEIRYVIRAALEAQGHAQKDKP